MTIYQRIAPTRLAKTLIAAAMALASTSIATSASAAELVTNGGFETGDFTGWTQGGNPGFTFVSGSAAKSGGFGALLGPIGSLGYLTQTLSTVAGETYAISFDLANDGGTPNKFSVSFDGVPGFLISNFFGFSYASFGFSGVATGPSTVLEIAFRQDPAFFQLDNVSVTGAAGGVPEPAVWGLLLIGFGLVGAGMRARNSSPLVLS